MENLGPNVLFLGSRWDHQSWIQETSQLSIKIGNSETVWLCEGIKNELLANDNTCSNKNVHDNYCG